MNDKVFWNFIQDKYIKKKFVSKSKMNPVDVYYRKKNKPSLRIETENLLIENPPFLYQRAKIRACKTYIKENNNYDDIADEAQPMEGKNALFVEPKKFSIGVNAFMYLPRDSSQSLISL